MFEFQEEIINKINRLDDVKRIKELKDILEKNEEYNRLINISPKNNKELVEIRKELYKIDEVVEYQKLYTKLKLDFNKINNTITSIVSNFTCNI